MIPRDRLSPEVQQEIFGLSPVVIVLDPQLTLLNAILKANRMDISLDGLRAQAKDSSETELKDRLLFSKGRLVVLDTKFNDCPIRTALIKEAYNQVSLAYPS